MVLPKAYFQEQSAAIADSARAAFMTKKYFGLTNKDLEDLDKDVKSYCKLSDTPCYHGGTVVKSDDGGHVFVPATQDGAISNYILGQQLMQSITDIKFQGAAKVNWEAYLAKENPKPNCWKPALDDNHVPTDVKQVSLFNILLENNGGVPLCLGYSAFCKHFWDRAGKYPETFNATYVTEETVPVWDVINSYKHDPLEEDESEEDEELSDIESDESNDDALTKAEINEKTAAKSKSLTMQASSTKPRGSLSEVSTSLNTADHFLRSARDEMAHHDPRDDFTDLEYPAPDHELAPLEYERATFEFINLFDKNNAYGDEISVGIVGKMLPCKNGRLLVREPYTKIFRYLAKKAKRVVKQMRAKSLVAVEVQGKTSDTKQEPVDAEEGDSKSKGKRLSSKTGLTEYRNPKKRVFPTHVAAASRMATRWLNSRHIIITGQPGVGKTYCQSYFLYMRTVSAQPTIIMVSNNCHFYFSATGVVQFADVSTAVSSGKLPRSLLDDPNIWYISDGRPDDAAIHHSIWFLIVISSSRKETFKDFQKQFSVETIYMPPFTWNEIFATGVFCEFLSIRELFQVWRNFVLYGPVARTLLETLLPGQRMYKRMLAEYEEKIVTEIIELLQNSPVTQIKTRWLDEDSDTIILTQPSTSDFKKPTRSFITLHVADMFTSIQDDHLRRACKMGKPSFSRSPVLQYIL